MLQLLCILCCIPFTVCKRLQSVKTERALQDGDGGFGANWEHAVGAEKSGKGRHLVGSSVPSERLRLDGDFKKAMIAEWAQSPARPGAELLVRCAPFTLPVKLSNNK